MSLQIHISEHLFQSAAQKGKIEQRNAAKQIEYWAEIGRSVERHTGITAMDLLKISSGVKTVKIEEMETDSIATATVLGLIETDKASNAFKEGILRKGPTYQRCLTNLNYLEQIHPGGSKKVGNFINGHFVEKV